MGKRTKNVSKKKSSKSLSSVTSSSIQDDKDIPTTECPGTFRWTEGKQFPSLPNHPSSNPQFSRYKGWGDYLMWRGGQSLMMDLQKDMSLIDCLSSPITLLSMMSMLKLVPGKVLHLVLLGASRRAEEFILRHTLAWQEVCCFQSQNSQIGMTPFVSRLRTLFPKQMFDYILWVPKLLALPTSHVMLRIWIVLRSKGR
mmetsp:Transcript_5456/g.7092  ORF Transcript_5456/g.7092 Transcript_5456/m.7092 type:complete len:198 (+) Transcript_5456:69-662(+)